MNVANVTAVVVTYNRLPLLKKCIAALLAQTLAPALVRVIDNASTDGTETWLNALASGEHSGRFTVVRLVENTGGAGGFSKGLHSALEGGNTNWVWMMDDDAEPCPDALEELMRVADDPAHIYGSLAVSSGETSWLTTVLDPPLGEIGLAEDVPTRAKVQSLPFLGFLAHRSLVERIGLPDEGYFIAADDIEYCVRAQSAGADIIMAGKSRIEHPKSRPYKVRVLGRTLTCLALPPWKRYYDTRNRLLIARNHYGLRLFTETIPGSLVRLVSALMKEPGKLAQAWAFFAGFVDGLLGIKGKRHEKWGIRP